MKQILATLALVAGVFTAANAQEQNNPSRGDFFNGLTRPITFNRMIPPYALEVTFAKTVHIIFPAAIRYVDLGSIDLLAAKADGVENVLRVKAATQGFSRESNLSVITEEGSYYSFNVKYADEPVKLSVEMADFLHGWNFENKPGNEIPIYLSDLGNESPYLVRLIMEAIHRNNRTKIKHIGSKNFGVQYLLKEIYTHNELLFFHLSLKNSTTVSFNIDFITFNIVDKKVAKRTAIQERVIMPLRSYNQVTGVAGNREERTVFVLSKFTIPDDKQLIIELFEKDGGRNQTLTIENMDLIRAEVIDNLTVKMK
ncbi:MAG: conjugative transposon protein TraN [Bacteroidales bacterium]|nr:conjugative transposon protein TraN [Bacteroidales bacterium]